MKTSVPLAALVLLTVTATIADAEEWIWITEPFAADCQQVEGPKLDPDINLIDGEHDFVLHKCTNKYGPAMWLLYQDSARVSIGFGERASTVWTGVSLVRGDWPLEWGGTLSKHKFEPKTVTLRLISGDGDQSAGSALFVYKLLGKEPACLIARVESNEEARLAAAGANRNTKCMTEAEFR